MKNSTFYSQMEVFKSLGYKLNEGITKEIIFEDIGLEEEFEESEYEFLYQCLGSYNAIAHQYNTNNCILYDIEFLDPSSEYIEFMKRMGVISNGELVFSDISLFVDDADYEWIDFKVNGVHKKWKLEKVGYISDSFFQRFSYLPKEFGTKGKYTFYSDGGQQFVIDYATEEMQKLFIKTTGIKREWLGEGGHFSEPSDY